ncbi:MAG: DegQ family serine endoprotease [Pseudomonadota bacterium]
MRRTRSGTVFAALLLLSACKDFDWQTVREKFQKGDQKPWTENVASQQATVPFKGQALAADTFIRISKNADLGVVNIRTTKIYKQNRGYPFFFFGPNNQQQRSPFDDFFGGEDPFRQFFGGGPNNDPMEQKATSLGSGFVLNEDGYIVTNNHVVANQDEIMVTIGKDQEYKAKVIGTDRKTDVALIKIRPKEKLKPLTLGDSDQLQVGEIVIAIGNPFGLSHTVTQGIVSAKERSIGAGAYDNFIQTDASINPGNSGGPLLNLKAEVVGINSAIVASGQGIGFAIPINTAKNIIIQLKDKGAVTRGWLGVLIQKVDPELAKSLGLKDRRGALVSSVTKGSPAAKVGIKSGDLILKVDGKEISEFNELPRLIAEVAVGRKVTVEILRDGKPISFEVTIGELKQEKEAQADETEEEEPSKPMKPDRLGLVVAPLTDRIARELELEAGTAGVYIQSIDPTGTAAEKGVQRGDVIVELNKKKINNVGDYRKIMKSLGKGDTVLLLVRRGAGVTLYVAFTL